MKRMYDTGSKIYFTSAPWGSKSIDLINNSVGLQIVGSEDIQWSNGENKFFRQASDHKRFQSGMKVEPYLTGQGATAVWKGIQKTDFDSFPAVGANVNVILDLNSDDVVSIPEDNLTIKSDSYESTLIVLNTDKDAAAFHTVSIANSVPVSVSFDSISFLNDIKAWYREKGWLEESEDPDDGSISATITIPFKYVKITATGVEVKGEALPPSVNIHYSPSGLDYIYVIPREVIVPR